MRATLDKFLSRYNNPDLYFLHADMWGFKRFKERFPNRCINVGIQEPNLVNIAGGLASQGKKVIVYGVAGFIIHRAYEQIKFSVVHFGSSVTFVNAGANGCYSVAGKMNNTKFYLLICPMYDKSGNSIYYNLFSLAG
jgi:transketolase